MVICYGLLGEGEEEVNIEHPTSNIEVEGEEVIGQWSAVIGEIMKKPLLILLLLSLGPLSSLETECLNLEARFPFRKRWAGRPLSLKHGRDAHAPH